jgi:hypothetical protein
VTVYRLEGVRYGVPEVRELSGRQPVAVVPGLEVDWERFGAILGR